MQRSGASRRLAGLFLLLVGAALSVILLRPVCEIAFAHPGVGQNPAACCESVEDGTELDLADLATPGPGGKQVFGAFSYLLLSAAFSPRAVTLFASPALPARSYYTRSSRILR